MRIYIENAHVFFSLLATTGAASIAQYRLFFLEFLKIRCCFSLMRKFLSIFIMVFSFDTLLRRKYFDTLLRRKYSDADLHRKCTCFFSLLATTGAASLPQMPSFSFGFLRFSLPKTVRSENSPRFLSSRCISHMLVQKSHTNFKTVSFLRCK